MTPPPTTITPPPVTSAIDGIDRSKWSKSLVAAHSYLMEKEWGLRWTALLSALVEHEWSFYHPEEEGKLPKLRSSPMEYKDWMKEHHLMRDFKISPDFGDKLFQWWKDLGPLTQWQNVGNGEGQKKEPIHIHSDWWLPDWTKLHKQGCNSIVFLVLGLAWQGQSVCNAAAGDGLGAGEGALEANKVWQFMVDDIVWSCGMS
jgi:hypothetical protein